MIRAIHSDLVDRMRYAVLGELAEILREYFCSGPNGSFTGNRRAEQDLRSFRCIVAARAAAGRAAL